MANGAPGDGRGGSDPLSENFEERLRRAREGQRREHATAPPSLLGLAFRLATELVVAVAVGVAVGFFLDRWLGTAPWLLLLFFALGSAAGFVNVVRTARQMTIQSQAGPPAPPVNNDDED